MLTTVFELPMFIFLIADVAFDLITMVLIASYYLRKGGSDFD